MYISTYNPFQKNVSQKNLVSVDSCVILSKASQSSFFNKYSVVGLAQGLNKGGGYIVLIHTSGKILTRHYIFLTFEYDSQLSFQCIYFRSLFLNMKCNKPKNSSKETG